MLCNHVTQLAGLISAAGFYSRLMTVKLTLIWIFSDEASAQTCFLPKVTGTGALLIQFMHDILLMT
jgi:hypothetical protein